MVHLRKRQPWQLPERKVTPESVYWNRRQVLAAMGLGSLALGTTSLLPGSVDAAADSLETQLAKLPPLTATPNPRYQVDLPLTPRKIAAKYNNFYEFSTAKGDVWKLSQQLQTKPWTIQVSGLVDAPQRFDVEGLMRGLPLEQRVYRFRCVEAWSMVVPWIGFPLRALLERVQPQSGAKYVAFKTFLRPEQARRQTATRSFFSREPWPYTEGLTLPEAMHELTFLAVGIYGHVMPPQHGAPIRVVVPWKYGFKSIKSIDKIELTAERPKTFWNSIASHEYGFFSNVNPRVPHPRWSQASERDIATGDRKKTLPFNGYAAQVASLYTS